MNSCCNLYFLSALACELSKCLSEAELTKLSTDLVVLGDMLVSIIASNAVCEEKKQC